jgi:hypothetical protein
MGYGPAAPLILNLAAHSPLLLYSYSGNRGRPPIGYVKGMAIAFGRLYYRFLHGDEFAMDMARRDTGNDRRDVLTHCRSLFAIQKLENDRGGPEVLRNLFVLLVGLGMRESSGQFGVGQDTGGTNNTGSTSAEAGLFQVSYNSHGSTILLDRLFQKYRGRTDLIEIFRQGVGTPSAHNQQTFGTGTGAEFQKLSKACPAFAVEYAAIVLRHNCQYSGPIIRRTIDMPWQCIQLFRDVQHIIDQGHGLAV